MKKAIKIMMAAMLLAGCSADDTIVSDSEQGMNVEVADNGFQSTDGTRAEEKDYSTTFTSGDKIGVFAVRNGAIDKRASNVCMTIGDDGKWTGDLYYIPNATYYAYYPYASGTIGDASADDFFSDMAKNWNPQNDQSSYSAYTASDLMTSKATNPTGSTITFEMTHRMGLAVIKFNSETPTDLLWDTTHNPYTFSDGSYRLIVNPNSGGTTIAGSYSSDMKYFSFTANPSEGKYITYTISNSE